jgi:hypothetical protein
MHCIALSRNGNRLGADVEVASFRDLPPAAFRDLLNVR